MMSSVAQAPCYFVVAHDGDNSSGRAGSEETWNNSSDVTYADSDWRLWVWMSI